MAEEARLESVYTSKANPGFESRSLRRSLRVQSFPDRKPVNPVTPQEFSLFYFLFEMKKLIGRFAIATILLACFSFSAQAQGDTVSTPSASADTALFDDVLNPDSITFDDAAMASVDSLLEAEENPGLHQQLKKKFIEGNPAFMSLVALVLVLGLAFCIERIIYLSLSEVNAKKLMADVEERVLKGDIDGAKTLCRETRGPVASICYQGLLRIRESMDDIERSIVSYGSVQTANLEKGCSWITLFIAMAPSLGFLGTVIGMVMAFDQVQQAGDLNASVVAAGMKVALITTIFGIIVALILQVFYSYILTKIEHLTSQMEESAISLLDTIMKYKQSDKDI